MTSGDITMARIFGRGIKGLRPRHGFGLFGLLVLFASLARMPAAMAEQKPLWELGVGVGAINFPDYPGSDQRHSYVLPLPYVIYRGKFIQADQGGVQGKLLGGDKAEFYISLGAAPPVSSHDNHARSGLPGLLPRVEVGPGLELHLWRTLDRHMQLDFLAPVRAAITFNFHPQYVGLVFAPALDFDAHDLPHLHGWDFGVLAGPRFTDRTYNETIYGVPAAYARPNRPAYSTAGGYAGAQFTAAVSRRFSNFWLGAFVRYDELRGAAFADSPLVRRQDAVSFGFAAAWIFAQSRRMVDVPE